MRLPGETDPWSDPRLSGEWWVPGNDRTERESVDVDLDRVTDAAGGERPFLIELAEIQLGSVEPIVVGKRAGEMVSPVVGFVVVA